jgi:8-oxo-dGTP pyrophosphatase MutT (NUDIX family)
MKRSQLVETHKGQVSFPGGHRETSDLDLLHTALRETEEEIGVKREHIQVLGRLTPVKTRGEVLIYPWVGRMNLPYTFSLSVAEVDRLLFLPLNQLLTEGLKAMDVDVGPFKVKSIGLFAEGELVWGATAKMLEELRQVLLKLNL